MVHQAIVNLQDEKLALEPIHVAKHFPDKPGNFEVLRIKIGRCVIHVLKSSNRKSEGQNILRHLNKYLAFSRQHPAHTLIYFAGKTCNSSTSNTRSEFGGIDGGAPASP